jgi:hypothetical protein
MCNTEILQAYYKSLDDREKQEFNKAVKSRCFVSSNTVYKWTHGLRFPRKLQQNIIAEVTGIPVDKLFKNS